MIERADILLRRCIMILVPPRQLHPFSMIVDAMNKRKRQSHVLFIYVTSTYPPYM